MDPCAKSFLCRSRSAHDHHRRSTRHTLDDVPRRNAPLRSVAATQYTNGPVIHLTAMPNRTKTTQHVIIPRNLALATSTPSRSQIDRKRSPVIESTNHNTLIAKGIMADPVRGKKGTPLHLVVGVALKVERVVCQTRSVVPPCVPRPTRRTVFTPEQHADPKFNASGGFIEKSNSVAWLLGRYFGRILAGWWEESFIIWGRPRFV